MKISRHPNGKLYTTLTVNSTKKFIYGDTPEEVKLKYNELKYKYNQGYNVTDNPTLEEYMIVWYKAFKAGEGALKTQEMYQNCINHHINPALGKKKIKEITGTQVQNFIKSIKSSKSLAHKVRITLNQVYKQAIADHLVSFNPVSATKIIAPDNPKRVCLTPIQHDLLLSILKNHRIYPLVYFILYTGVRLGEALALFWKDIDFKNRVILVTKATEYDHSKPQPKAPKTKKGVREIPIPEELYNYLKTYKKSIKGLYVFPGHAGGPMGLTEIKRFMRRSNNRLKSWFKNPKNKDYTNHKFTLTARLLRHTYCTALYDAGVDENSAAELMGHDVSIMRSVYTHIQEERKKKTVTKLDSLYGKTTITEIKNTN